MQTISISAKAKSVCSKPITERVKSFEDACEVLGIDGQIMSGSLHDALDGGSESIAAYTKLILIARALNEGWKPNWKDSNEAKYYPYWNMDSGFSLGVANACYQCAGVPSCLCFKNKEVANYASETFYELYKSYMVVA